MSDHDILKQFLRQDRGKIECRRQSQRQRPKVTKESVSESLYNLRNHLLTSS